MRVHMRARDKSEDGHTRARTRAHARTRARAHTHTHRVRPARSRESSDESGAVPNPRQSLPGSSDVVVLTTTFQLAQETAPTGDRCFQDNLTSIFLNR